MGRRKSAKEIAKQLEYAKKREAYNPPVREENGTTRRRPKITVKYKVTSPLAPASTEFTIQASKESVEFFGKGTLNLQDVGTDPQPPRGFKPNRMMATVADSSPNLVRAKGTGRPYIKYTRGSVGSNVQSSYTAPISTSSGASTLDNAVSAAVAAVKGKLGGAFGRVWFEPEDYPFSASGV